MLRYYLISTALVLTLGAILAAFHRPGHELRVASVQSTASPSPPRRQGTSAYLARVPNGDAPWAMSALPECFHQRHEVHGPRGFVLAHLPAGARRIPPGTSVSSKDCTVVVGERSIDVRRGD